jgi:hypothetical protein
LRTYVAVDGGRDVVEGVDRNLIDFHRGGDAGLVVIYQLVNGIFVFHVTVVETGVDDSHVAVDDLYNREEMIVECNVEIVLVGGQVDRDMVNFARLRNRGNNSVEDLNLNLYLNLCCLKVGIQMIVE